MRHDTVSVRRCSASTRLRPLRARRASRRRTRILLRASGARRALPSRLIGSGLALALAEANFRLIGHDLAIPAATVRGWLQGGCHVEVIRRNAMYQLGLIDGTLSVLPGGRAAPRLLTRSTHTVAAAALLAIIGHGFTRADIWPLLGRTGWPATPARIG